MPAGIYSVIHKCSRYINDIHMQFTWADSWRQVCRWISRRGGGTLVCVGTQQVRVRVECVRVCFVRVLFVCVGGLYVCVMCA